MKSKLISRIGVFLGLTLFALLAVASVPSSTTWVQYVLSSNPQTLTVPFVFTASSDLLVLDSKASPPVTLVQNSDYSVSGGNGSTGTISTIAGGTNAVQSGDTITISRGVPLTQTTNYINGGPLTASMIGQSFDKLTEVSQQINLVAANSLQFQQDEQISGVMSKTLRKNNYLAFDANGNMVFLPGTAGTAYALSSIYPNTPLPSAGQFFVGNTAGTAYAPTTVQVASVSALKSLTVGSYATGFQVTLGGYYVNGDGGGGTFYYDSSSSATDNGGTVIQPTTGTGRWIRIFGSSISLQSFGAKGDGVADDTTKIQSALNWAAATASVTSSCNISSSPNKIYLVSSPLKIIGNYYTIDFNFATINAGAAIDSIIQLAPGSTNTGQHIRICNAILNANSNANYCIHVEQGFVCDIRDIHALGYVVAAYYTDGTTNKTTQTVKFTNCSATGTVVGFLFNINGNISSFTSFTLDNCDVEGASSAIKSYGVGNLNIVGGVFENCTANSIWLSATGCVLTNTSVENGNGQKNIYLTSSSSLYSARDSFFNDIVFGDSSSVLYNGFLSGATNAGTFTPAITSNGLGSFPSLTITGTATGLTNKAFYLNASVTGPNAVGAALNPTVIMNGGIGAPSISSIGGSFTNSTGGTLNWFRTIDIEPSNVTATNPITNGATVYIGGSVPNVSNPYALYIASGPVYLGTGATNLAAIFTANQLVSNGAIYAYSAGYGNAGYLISSGSAGLVGSETGDFYIRSNNQNAIHIDGSQNVNAYADFITTVAGKTLKVQSGTNAKAGTFTLVAGAATVSNTSVTANSVIEVTLKTVGGTRAGNPDIVPTASTGFTAAGAATDTSTYNYIILEVK